VTEDCFRGVAIFDHTRTRRDLGWLRARYGDSPQFESREFRIERIWEQSQAMTCGVYVLDPAGSGIVGFPVTIAWFGTSQDAVTRDQGWVDVPLWGGNYNVGAGAKGGMSIVAKDGSFSYTGIGWPDATNHDHLNLDLRRLAAPLPPEPEPPEPGEPGEPVDSGLITATKADLTAIQMLAERALRRLP
jgi:hypothetical protein